MAAAGLDVELAPVGPRYRVPVDIRRRPCWSMCGGGAEGPGPSCCVCGTSSSLLLESPLCRRAPDAPCPLLAQRPTRRNASPRATAFLCRCCRVRVSSLSCGLSACAPPLSHAVPHALRHRCDGGRAAARRRTAPPPTASRLSI